MLKSAHPGNADDAGPRRPLGLAPVDAREGQPRKVILADPSEVYRVGVKSLLAGLDWAEVVAETDDEVGLVALLEEIDADVLLLDPRIAKDATVDVIGRVRELAPTIGVVVVTDVPDEHIRRVIELGAEGCLRKEAGSDELTAALHLVADGLHYIQAELVGPLLDGGSPNGRPGKFSADQLEILRLVTRGLKNKQVASRLDMSVTTVKSQLRLIYSQLDASSRAEAVAAAVRLGIVE